MQQEIPAYPQPLQVSFAILPDQAPFFGKQAFSLLQIGGLVDVENGIGLVDPRKVDLDSLDLPEIGRHAQIIRCCEMCSQSG